MDYRNSSILGLNNQGHFIMQAIYRDPTQVRLMNEAARRAARVGKRTSKGDRIKDKRHRKIKEGIQKNELIDKIAKKNNVTEHVARKIKKFAL